MREHTYMEIPGARVVEWRCVREITEHRTREVEDGHVLPSDIPGGYPYREVGEIEYLLVVEHENGRTAHRRGPFSLLTTDVGEHFAIVEENGQAFKIPLAPECTGCSGSKSK